MKIEEFKRLNLDEITLIDIREADEIGGSAPMPKIKQAIWVPKDRLIKGIEDGWLAGEIDDHTPIYLICRTGMRTDFMAMVLQGKGWEAISVEGGMDIYLNNK